MAYVVPKAKVVLCRGTGLSPDYNHTYRFKTVDEQIQFFTKEKAYHTFTDYTYVRDNKIRVDYEATYLYACDYLCFNEMRNGDTGQRWYYAFITDIRYINENTAEISYEIDLLQTWFYRMFINGNMPRMYIIRQHSPTDALYENTQPENFDLGGETFYEAYGWNNLAVKATYNNVSKGNYQGVYGGWLPCIAEPIDNNQNVLFRSGIPSPVRIHSFKYELAGANGNDGNAFVSYLRHMDAAKLPEIVDMFMYPEALIPNSSSQKIVTEEIEKAGKNGFNPWKSDGYTPVNKKCYTYPYCYAVVTNGCGQLREFRYEYFPRNYNKANFDISGTFVPDPEFYCTARNYGGIVGQNAVNTVALKGVPKIPWITDAYKVYMAQNAASVGVENAGMAVTGIQSLAAAVLGGPGGLALSLMGGGMQSVLSKAGTAGQAANAGASAGGSAISGAFDIAQTLAKRQDLKKAADTIHTGAAPQAMYLNGVFGFKAYTARIPIEYLMRIDRHFTAYGYAFNDYGIPNIFSRRDWNYLRATDMAFDSFIPIDARVAAANILANGITFWDKSVEIGSYPSTNPIA